MTESMHDFVVRRLQESKGTWPLISDQSGVPLRTIEKIARREYKSHRLSTIEPLADHFEYFRQFEQRRRRAN